MSTSPISRRWRKPRSGWRISSIVAEELFYDLDGPIVRITTPHIPLASADELEAFLSHGVELPAITLPDRLSGVVGKWLEALGSELEALVGKDIDPRFVGCLHMRL